MSTKSTAVFLTLLPLLASIIPTTLAQTSTDCNPLNSTNCPIDTALGVGNYSIDFTTSTMSTTVWNTTDGTVNYGNDGAEFTIAQRFDAPTVQSNFYLFFGTTEVIMQTAPGQGIISSIVLLSDDLDEIDWELMGGNNSYVETNYYGKGNQSERNALYYPIQTPEQIFHNYTVHWTAERLDWYIDGQVVRTLLYDDAEGGNSYPQTPMRFKMGIWAGGDPKMPPGTIAWAGGETDYSKAPFTMTIKSVRISDASRGTAYQYGDTSGTWESIKVLNNTPPLKLDGNNSEGAIQDARQKWNSLSSKTKIAVGASVAGTCLAAACVFAFCCIKQRRLGRKEKEIEDAKFEKSTAELMAYRAEAAARQMQWQQQRQQQAPRQGGIPQTYVKGHTQRGSWGVLNAARGYQRF